MKPLVGISCHEVEDGEKYSVSKCYVQAVVNAGGTPLLLPAVCASVTHYVNVLDGLLLSGGVDVDPIFFNEEPLPEMGEMTPVRDQFEISLVRQFLERDKPLLAICRGMQVLNIAAGGDIYQDIYSQYSKAYKHSQQAARQFPSHKISISTRTQLEKLASSLSLRVNSFHHQAIRKVAPGFIVSARCGDGLAEAIESTRHKFVLAVQWHPEWHNDDTSVKIFRTFINQCINK